jgi:hypothetical protein
MLIQAGGAALATMVGSGCARSAPSGGASAGRLLHRVRPSDPAWPRAAAWETLNRQVGGRLSTPAWPLEACRDAPRSESCAEVFNWAADAGQVGQFIHGLQSTWLPGALLRGEAQACWGSNYERLLAVKDRYDPDGPFLVDHGVGSERWSPDGFTRLA